MTDYLTTHETIVWYLMEVNALQNFNDYYKSGQRYGQAFFNALPVEDQNKLRGTLWDTFYKKEPFDCYLAIEHVLTK